MNEPNLVRATPDLQAKAKRAWLFWTGVAVGLFVGFLLGLFSLIYPLL